MNALLKLSRLIDALTERIGRLTTWVVLIVALISAGNATMRYTINWSSNGLLEIQWYLFSALFLLCAGYTLLKNEHVRIDIINGRFSARTRAWIDVFGFIFFFFPMVYLFVSLGWPFFMMSFSGDEMSSNAGGLIRWPVKLLLPVGFALLALQGLSELIKRFAFLSGLIGDPTEKGGISAEEELAAAIAANATAARGADK
ncbi:TRAP transporter small permease subunit [Rhodocyclus tenuis]|uniref:TRAP transporter small permease protein n=1 Tax=Rhodocyclus tenuis TaxID=1066 RepID=A0A840FZQ6_RHOTE|nr:TRAP transporter small permease subunit [Rhodocyclus tenuis]MBB4247384.1 TRAP-type mannitol/chloroaromatic compound transport system permease small subunit [Rhodocyclus tenuis]MBK1681224.1 sugar transporter [Rhodocyclus tenuis]